MGQIDVFSLKHFSSTAGSPRNAEHVGQPEASQSDVLLAVYEKWSPAPNSRIILMAICLFISPSNERPDGLMWISIAYALATNGRSKSGQTGLDSKRLLCSIYSTVCFTTCVPQLGSAKPSVCLNPCSRQEKLVEFGYWLKTNCWKMQQFKVKKIKNK